MFMEESQQNDEEREKKLLQSEMLIELLSYFKISNFLVISFCILQILIWISLKFISIDAINTITVFVKNSLVSILNLICIYYVTALQKPNNTSVKKHINIIAICMKFCFIFSCIELFYTLIFSFQGYLWKILNGFVLSERIISMLITTIFLVITLNFASVLIAYIYSKKLKHISKQDYIKVLVKTSGRGEILYSNEQIDPSDENDLGQV